ncbi:MAG: hypothetical protein ACRC2J_16845 [Microcoleaceae cyanobacterium]
MTSTVAKKRAIIEAINGTNKVKAVSLTKAGIDLALVDRSQATSLHRRFHPRVVRAIDQLPLHFDRSHNASMANIAS